MCCAISRRHVAPVGPCAAATYAVPAEWTHRFGLRRAGFHALLLDLLRHGVTADELEHVLNERSGLTVRRCLGLYSR